MNRILLQNIHTFGGVLILRLMSAFFSRCPLYPNWTLVYFGKLRGLPYVETYITRRAPLRRQVKMDRERLGMVSSTVSGCQFVAPSCSLGDVGDATKFRSELILINCVAVRN